MLQPPGPICATRRAIIAAGVGLALAPPALASPPQRFRPGPPWNAPRADAALPLNLALETVDGETTLGTVMNGRPAVVNLWATWCGPCRMEKPALNQLARQEAARGDRIAIISIIAFDEAVNGGESLRRAYGRFNAPALTPLRATTAAERVLRGHFGESSRGQRRTSLPTSGLFDRAGRELGRISGAAIIGSDQRLYWTDPAASRMFDRLAEFQA
jgi:thiol-disulfide isomerase/thioredoxin